MREVPRRWRMQNGRMPNVASVLKAEVTRLARKEVRQGLQGLHKSAAAHRAEIAALKRKVAELGKHIKVLSKAAARGESVPKTHAVADDLDGAANLRFRAAGMAANRKRLGLSAKEFGLLIGASGQSVYLWEQAKGKPGPRYLAAIAELRGIGKKEVAARLARLRAAR